MNSYTYQVKLSNHNPHLVKVHQMELTIEAPNMVVAARTLENYLNNFFARQPELEWTFDLTDYVRGGKEV